VLRGGEGGIFLMGKYWQKFDKNWHDIAVSPNVTC